MIPLALIVGFLGAGKTRFLTELLPALHSRGLRPRVILNDLENATIDASRLAELNALVTPLNGECVCCTSLRELMDALQSVEGSPGDIMIIEANGATEADELLGVLTMDRRLAQYSLPVQLTIVDASRWQKRWFSNALEIAQTRTATHVYLNWTAKLKSARVDAVKESVRSVNPRAEYTSPGDFADALGALSSSPGAVRDAKRATAVSGAHGHRHPFASATMPLPTLVDRTMFDSFVRSLPPAVVRAKGLVRFADRPQEMFVWNRVEGKKRLMLDPSSPHAAAQPVALFIGVDLPVASISDAIAAMDSPGP